MNLNLNYIKYPCLLGNFFGSTQQNKLKDIFYSLSKNQQ
jgi:hypothetical protein